MQVNPNSRAKRWVFTLNNWTSDDVDTIVERLEPECKYLVFGREVGEGGTPHLQGYVHLKQCLRFNALKALIGNRVHLAVARGTAQEAADYCKKDGDYEEFGECDAGQGKRTDWDRYKEFVIDLGRVPSQREIINHNMSLYARYNKHCVEIAKAILEPPTLTASQPRLGWQTLCAGRITGSVENGANPRSIDFFVDPTGNSGKSWMTRWAMSQWPDKVQVLRVGKRDDLAHAIDETKSVFLFDIPRQQMEYLQYSVLEMLKDQMVFSPKYHSMTKILHTVPHVAVFCNEAPDLDKMTDDRYHVTEI